MKGDGAEFRRARIFLSGTRWQNFVFKAQYDFAGGDADWKDVYLSMQNIPVAGEVLVGQMHEPFSLEELTSSNYNKFIERSSSLDSTEADDPAFQGAYLYGSWFATGENRSYSTSLGQFSRVKPASDFTEGGIGALELAARWSWLDLNDSNILGGEQNDITLALNWY